MDFVAVVDGQLSLQERAHIVAELTPDPAIGLPGAGLDVLAIGFVEAQHPGIRPYAQLAVGLFAGWQWQPDVTYDEHDDPGPRLAAAIARQTGASLTGPPPGEVFAAISRAWILEGCRRELRWRQAQDAPPTWPRSPVLDACRAWRFADEGALSSKLGGGTWALERGIGDPNLIEAALRSQRGEPIGNPDPGEVKHLLGAALQHLEGAAWRRALPSGVGRCLTEPVPHRDVAHLDGELALLGQRCSSPIAGAVGEIEQPVAADPSGTGQRDQLGGDGASRPGRVAPSPEFEARRCRHSERSEPEGCPADLLIDHEGPCRALCGDTGNDGRGEGEQFGADGNAGGGIRLAMHVANLRRTRLVIRASVADRRRGAIVSNGDKQLGTAVLLHEMLCLDEYRRLVGAPAQVAEQSRPLGRQLVASITLHPTSVALPIAYRSLRAGAQLHPVA